MTPPITVIISQPAIIIQGNLTMPIFAFLPFTFTCTSQGQKTFGPLPSTPVTVWLYINGAGQNLEGGDFSISGNNIITSQGCNIGDTIYGVIQL